MAGDEYSVFIHTYAGLTGHPLLSSLCSKVGSQVLCSVTDYTPNQEGFANLFLQVITPLQVTWLTL